MIEYVLCLFKLLIENLDLLCLVCLSVVLTVKRNFNVCSSMKELLLIVKKG
jgi:hypothetical protein